MRSVNLAAGFGHIMPVTICLGERESIGVVVRGPPRAKVARVDQAALILAHLRHHHRVRVANHAAVVAVLGHHRSQGRVDPQVGAT